MFALIDVVKPSGTDDNWSVREMRVLVTIDDPRHTDHYFDQLHRRKEELEESAGEELVWRKRPNLRRSTVGVHRTVDPDGLGDRNAQYAWLLGRLETLHSTFYDAVQTLDSPG